MKKNSSVFGKLASSPKLLIFLSTIIFLACIVSLTVKSILVKKNQSTDRTASAEIIQLIPNTPGNTPGNIVNRGYVASKDDYVIYQDTYYYDLRKLMTDGSSDIKLTSGRIYADNLNISGSWLYYCDSLDNFNIYRISLDGKCKERLTDLKEKRNIQYINLLNGYIYYCEGTESKYGILYKMDLNGKEKARLTDELVKDININGEWIYYTSYIDNGSLYKMKTDGSSKTRLSEDSSESIIVDSDTVYYINKSDGDKLYKISTDGNSRAKICDDSAGCLNYSEGFLYYSNISDSWKLYKIRPDGSARLKLSDDDPVNLNIAGGWIYYTCWNNYFNIFRIKTDGSERQKVR